VLNFQWSISSCLWTKAVNKLLVNWRFGPSDEIGKVFFTRGVYHQRQSINGMEDVPMINFPRDNKRKRMWRLNGWNEWKKWREPEHFAYLCLTFSDLCLWTNVVNKLLVNWRFESSDEIEERYFHQKRTPPKTIDQGMEDMPMIQEKIWRDQWNDTKENVEIE